MTEAEILADFPYLEAEDLRASLAIRGGHPAEADGGAGPVMLLFDQNLSPRLVRLLGDLYPDSVHVHELGLDAVRDTALWQHAAGRG